MDPILPTPPPIPLTQPRQAQLLQLQQTLSDELNKIWAQGMHFQTMRSDVENQGCGLDSGILWHSRFGTYWQHFASLGGLKLRDSHMALAQADLEKETGNIISLIGCMYALDEKIDHDTGRIWALKLAKDASNAYTGSESIMPILETPSFWLTPIGKYLKETDYNLNIWRQGNENGKNLALKSAQEALHQMVWCLQYYLEQSDATS